MTKVQRANIRSFRQIQKLSFLFILFFITISYAQSQNIQAMQWDKNFQIHITLANDSNYILDIKKLHHSKLKDYDLSDFTYIPVKLENRFVDKLLQTKLDSSSLNIQNTNSNKTLWSAIHYSIGGGWVHFINCLLYSLETGYLNVKAPLMKRPESRWKPKPMTNSYKRTKKWEYYIPINQKLAIREYKIKEKENSLGHLKNIPKEFINQFLATKQSNYKKLKPRSTKKARIDMIKILIGANYLSETQIKYIKSMVLKAFAKYTEEHLPSIIIFDDFNAAVAMSLNESGYQINKITFSDNKFIDDNIKTERTDQISMIIAQINEINKEVFQQKLKSHYN